MKFEERPFIAIWETTQACDLVCKHCRATARPERDRGELSTAEAKRLLDQFAQAQVPLVIFTGGDPAKRDDLIELVRYGSSIGLSIGLTPSATPLITAELLHQLYDAGLRRLAISIDGTTAQVHDSFRGRPGSYDRSYEILLQARDIGISTQVNTTLHAGNLDKLPTFVSQFTSLGISLWSVFVMVPTGRAKLELVPSASAVEHALEELLEFSAHTPFAIKTTAGPQYRRLALARKKRGEGDTVIGMRGRQAMWVNEGRGFLFVSHRGEVFPSGFLPTSAGNVREHNPIELYQHHPLFRSLRDADLLQGKCGICSYRHVCGGSRARAYAMKNNMLASDPLCPYIPPGYHGPNDVFEGQVGHRHLTIAQ